MTSNMDASNASQHERTRQLLSVKLLPNARGKDVPELS